MKRAGTRNVFFFTWPKIIQIFECWDDANKMQIRKSELVLKLYSEQRNWKQKVP